MQTSDEPPSWNTILATGQVNRLGPHHCFTNVSSLHAFHTFSTGALKMRVMTMFVVSIIMFLSFADGLLLAKLNSPFEKLLSIFFLVKPKMPVKIIAVNKQPTVEPGYRFMILKFKSHNAFFDTALFFTCDKIISLQPLSPDRQ
jgi:hypothetical protein